MLDKGCWLWLVGGITMKQNRFIRNSINLFAAISVLAIFNSCADIFQERVAIQTGSELGSLLSLLYTEKTGGQLAAPEQIFVSENEFNNKIVISWSTVNNAKSYRLERAVVTERDLNGDFALPDESAYELLEHSKNIYGTSFTDTIITDSTNDELNYLNKKYSYAYFYRVQAENAQGGYDDSNFAVSTAGFLLTPPDKVKGSLGESDTYVRIQWAKIAGAKQYKIYRSRNEDGSSATLIGSVTGNQNWFINNMLASEQGQDFYYYVKAFTGKEASVQSNIALGYSLVEGAPEQVKNVKVSDIQGRGDTTPAEGIKITWDASASGMMYAIVRSSSVDSTLTKLKQDLTTNSYTDTKGLKPNVYYYYQVQAYRKESDGTIVKGAMSDSSQNSTAPAEGYLLSQPESVSVTKIKNSSKCKITFSAPIGSEDYTQDSHKYSDYKNFTYTVYGNTTSNGVFDNQVATIDVSSMQAVNGYYTYEFDNTGGYGYFQMATNNGSKKSENSSTVAPAPYAAESPYATKAEKIIGWTDNDENANENGVHAVKITWKAPEGGADGGYHVYRSTKPNSGFRKITEEAVMTYDSAEQKFYFIDLYDSAKPNTYYYYKILSLNSLGQGANYTTTVIGYGALTIFQYLREYIKTTLRSQEKLTLMHKPNDMDKLGSESKPGEISGSLSYNASANIASASGRVLMHYTNYCDFFIMNDSSYGPYFLLNGDTNTTANMSGNGNMDGTVTVQGMYPGSVCYDKIEIKGSAAGGGTYGVIRQGIDSKAVQASWLWGEKNL